jgi:predicted molibdopterin-dependent oxidoreductase YjgC
MPNDSLFKTVTGASPQRIKIWIDGQCCQVSEGISVAAALLQTGVRACRTTPVSGQPRAPFCMMGQCFDCLVEIDGLSNQQACMQHVREGMQIVAMDGARSLC